MKVGDLVRVEKNDSDIRGRTSGIILKFDSSRTTGTEIVEVLWASGPSWILLQRIESIQACLNI